MTKELKTTLTEAEYKAMEFVAFDVHEWANNAIKERARVASLEITNILVAYCNANSIQLSVGQENQVMQAYELGLIKTAKEREIEKGVNDGTFKN